MKFCYSLLILIISVWIQYLIKTNNLILYVHPRYVEFTDIASIITILFSLVCIYIFFKNVHTNFIDFKFSFSFGGLALLLLMVSILLPPKSLTSATVTQRGIGDSLKTNKQDISIASNPFLDMSSINYEISDWLNLFYLDTDIENYVGKPVKISGFAYINGFENANTSENKYFKLARFVITCCAVDARPVGLIIKYNESLAKIEKDKWYRVEGTFIVDKNIDRNFPIVNATKFEIINEPEKPYIY